MIYTKFSGSDWMRRYGGDRVFIPRDLPYAFGNSAKMTGVAMRFQYFERYTDFPLSRLVKRLTTLFNAGAFKDSEQVVNFTNCAILSTLTVIDTCINGALPFGVTIDGKSAITLVPTITKRQLSVAVGFPHIDYTEVKDVEPHVQKALAVCRNKYGVDVKVKSIKGFYVFYIDLTYFEKFQEQAENEARLEQLKDSGELPEFDFNDPLKGVL